MKTINIVAAIIIRDGKVFATQRGYGEWKDGSFPAVRLSFGTNNLGIYAFPCIGRKGVIVGGKVFLLMEGKFSWVQRKGEENEIKTRVARDTQVFF